LELDDSKHLGKHMQRIMQKQECRQALIDLTMLHACMVCIALWQ